MGTLKQICTIASAQEDTIFAGDLFILWSGDVKFVAAEPKRMSATQIIDCSISFY